MCFIRLKTKVKESNKVSNVNNRYDGQSERQRTALLL